MLANTPYELDKLDLPALQKLLKIVEDIKQKSELQSKTKNFEIWHFGLPGIKHDEHRDIFWGLSSRGYIHADMYYGVIATIDEAFFKFREDLIKEIEKRKALLKLKNIQHEYPHYDSINGVLHVQGHRIKIKARPNQETKQHIILKEIFKEDRDITLEIAYSEINIGEIEKTDWKVFRNAFRAINEKISQETFGAVDEFFHFGNSNSGSVKINPKYL